MGEDGSEEEGIVFAVGNGAGGSIGVPSVSGGTGVVTSGAQSGVIEVHVEWLGLGGQNVFVLHIEVAHGTGVVVVDSDTVFGVPPSVTETINGVLDGSSGEAGVSKMAPASVFENVGQSEQVHDISVVSG